MASRIRPVLKINRASTASVLGRAYLVNNGMGGDTGRFSMPTPALAILQEQIAKLEAAERETFTRTKGTVASRNLERDRLVSMLETECAYVKTLCDASPEEAAVIVQRAGMVSAVPRVFVQQILAVTCGATSGTVELDAAVAVLAGRTGKRRFFNWQWTTDGGRTFVDAPSTPVGNTSIAGLAPMTMVGFRVRVTTAEGPGEWTDIVTILVH